MAALQAVVCVGLSFSYLLPVDGRVKNKRIVGAVDTCVFRLFCKSDICVYDSIWYQSGKGDVDAMMRTATFVWQQG